MMDSKKVKTNKAIASEITQEKIEKGVNSINFSASTTLSYDDLMEPFHVYNNHSKKRMTPLDVCKKRHRVFVTVMIILILILASFIVVTGIFAFGGIKK